MKSEFMKYLGQSDSLAGYQKSNRLVLLKTLFSLIDENGKALVNDVVDLYKEFYISRKEQGLVVDIGADHVINNIENSTHAEILNVIKRHPYRVLNEKGYLDTCSINNLEYFIFNSKLMEELKIEDIECIRIVIVKKLLLYYSKIDKEENSIIETISLNNKTIKVDTPTFEDESSKSKVIHLNEKHVQQFSRENIEVLCLSIRSYNCLFGAGITTIQELSNLADKDLMSIKNLGKTSLDEIKIALNKYTSIKKMQTLGNYNKVIKKEPVSKIFKMNIEVLLGIYTREKLVGFELSDEERLHLRLYEEVINELGVELCRQYYEQPQIAISVAQILDAFLSSDNRINMLAKSLGEIDSSNENAKLKPLIRALIHDTQVQETMLEVSKAYEFVSDIIHLLKLIAKDDMLFNGFTYLMQVLRDDIKQWLNNEFASMCKSKRHIEIMKARANSTLQEAGDKFGITRERIRQIEKKVDMSFLQFYDRTNPAFIINAFSASNIGFTELDIKKVFSEHANLFTYCLKKKVFEGLIWSDELDSFVIGDTDWYNVVLAEIENLPNRITNTQVDGFVSAIKQDLNLSIEGSIIKKILLSFYKQVGEYFSKSRFTRKDMYKIVIEQYYPNGIKLFDEFEMMRFKAYMEDSFGEIKWSAESTRSISARITDFTVLCDRGKYILPTIIQIDTNLLNDIHSFIFSHDRSSVMFTEIFETFKDRLLSESNIHNRYFLQGVLKYYWKDEFSFSRDVISRGSGEERSIRKHIEEFIRKSDYPVTVKAIKEEFPGITDIVISIAIAENSDLLQWGFGEYIHSSMLDISDECTEKLKQELEFLLDGNTASVKAVYEHIFEKEHELLNKHKIYNNIALFSVYQYLFSDEYSFSRPYISNGNTGMTKDLLIEEYITNFDELSISDLKLFFEEKHITIMNFSAMIDNNCRDFIRIDNDILMRSSSLNINKGIIYNVENSIISTLRDKGYIAASKYDDFFFFPYIGAKWTGHLLVSIVKKYCDKLSISQYSTDHRYLTEIIYKNEIDVKTHNELICYAITFENKKAKFESIAEIESFLKNEGLIATTANIPSALFQNGTLEITEFGELKIN